MLVAVAKRYPSEVDQAVELGKISENEKEEHFTDAISDAYERMG